MRHIAQKDIMCSKRDKKVHNSAIYNTLIRGITEYKPITWQFLQKTKPMTRIFANHSVSKNKINEQ